VDGNIIQKQILNENINETVLIKL
ncbi:MAG: hypothetical protein K0S55_1250, partial [Clostridia bacterium]|nr:hypothetical protein [Clostridia bacterium]